MEWPSRNIPHGGILHPAKTSYNPETKKFLQLLMAETKLSTAQRNKLNYHLRNGEPLPAPIRAPSRGPNMPEVTIRPVSSKRRSREAIVQSGAYEIEAFRPTFPPVDREREKERLQQRMALGAHVGVKKVKVQVKRESGKVEKKDNRFDELIREIKEREDWLREMESLGLGNQYKQIIEQQIQEKVREMNKLSCGKGDH